MKKNITTALLPACLLSMSFLFSSCLKDNCNRTYKIFTPVYASLSSLRAAVQSKPAMPVTNAGKLYINDNWIFLNEQGKGIHVIDNSNPAHPVNTAFINIPGNIDMSVKGNILYADLYCDLAAINISNPKNIAVAKFLTNTFPERSVHTTNTNADSIEVITGYTSRDTTVSCNQNLQLCNNCYLNSIAPSSLYAASSAAPTPGVAGSMASFAAVDNYLYAVTTSNLNIVNISEAANPSFVSAKYIGWNIETIFPYNNKLYIGAGSNMSVYDLANPTDPQQLAWSGHWCSHDPIVADDTYAYVTLQQANVCGTNVNELDVYSFSAVGSSSLVKTYQMTNPKGLSKDGNLLFVCDDGLKIYDATDPANLKMIKHIPGIDTYDVIAYNGIAYVVTAGGLSQYDYSNLQNISLLSKLGK